MSSTVPGEAERRVLDPIERLSEILFALIMVLTFTGSLSVATADRGDVRTMLVGALGCNIAWGLIDAVMYLMASVNSHGLDIKAARAVKQAHSETHAHDIIRSNLPRVVAAELTPESLARIAARLRAMPLERARPRPSRDDLRGALGVFLIVAGATLPVILPFLFTKDVVLAMRTSNAIAIVMLALIGFYYGRSSGLSAWLMSAAMVLLGLVLVAITIALGG